MQTRSVSHAGALRWFSSLTRRVTIFFAEVVVSNWEAARRLRGGAFRSQQLGIGILGTLITDLALSHKTAAAGESAPMQLAIVHYHLNRGGVTQVIVNQLRALSLTHEGAQRLPVVILFGSRLQGWPHDLVDSLPGLQVSLCPVAELEYDTQPLHASERLHAALVTALNSHRCWPETTLLHVHNHALGKNVSLPGALAGLAKRGYPLLLQMHDFAEDFRPANFGNLVTALAPHAPGQLASQIYPQGPAIHYAVLNGRDHQLLHAAGVAPDRLHALPNPVSEVGVLPDRATARQRLRDRFAVPEDRPYVLYPVRGIRRKNVGEFLLWSAAHSDAQFALTLPPLNPQEQPRYRYWQERARELELPALFDAGDAGGLEFHENLAAADEILTTSVAEGFGMVFLETWLSGRSLCGRDLPEITADFRAHGLQLDQLSSEVRVPVTWVGREEWERELLAGYMRVLASYRRPLPSAIQFHDDASSLLADGLLDFARCSAKLQASVVSWVARDVGRRSELLELNPVLRSPLDLAAERLPVTARNAAVVRSHYCLRSSGLRLSDLYRTVLDSSRGHEEELPRGDLILDAFLSLPRFHPIRVE